MTKIGVPVRIKRDGKYIPVDIAEMTDVELDRFFVKQEHDRTVMWARFLAGWIRDNVVNVFENEKD